MTATREIHTPPAKPSREQLTALFRSAAAHLDLGEQLAILLTHVDTPALEAALDELASIADDNDTSDDEPEMSDEALGYYDELRRDNGAHEPFTGGAR